MDWKRTLVIGQDGVRRAQYRGSNPHNANHATVFTFEIDGRRLWAWSATVSGKRIEHDGAARTADLAKRACESAISAEVSRQYREAEASGFAADKEAGRKAGAAHFAHVDSYDRASLTARSLRADVRNGTAGYRAAKAHCGVFAPSAQHRAFAGAFRDSFYDAMQAAMDSRLIRRAALDVVQSGSTESAEIERIAREWSPGYAATLAPRIAAEVARLRAESVA